MKIGIDFDNTIVDYTGVFYQAARQWGIVPTYIGSTKEAVKHYLIGRDQEPLWTELQGKVYGQAIQSAKPYEGCKEVLSSWKKKGVELHLISHKTRYPIIGDKLDFHLAADEWLKAQSLYELFDSVNYCPQKSQKIQTINTKQVDYFVDDLLSVLTDVSLSPLINKIWFTQNNREDEPCSSGISLATSWQQVAQKVMAETDDVY